jgi:hypothetical protein
MPRPGNCSLGVRIDDERQTVDDVLFCGSGFSPCRSPLACKESEEGKIRFSTKLST